MYNRLEKGDYNDQKSDEKENSFRKKTRASCKDSKKNGSCNDNTCSLQVDGLQLGAARGQHGEVPECERLAELDVEVQEVVAGGREAAQHLAHVIPGGDAEAEEAAPHPGQQLRHGPRPRHGVAEQRDARPEAGVAAEPKQRPAREAEVAQLHLREASHDEEPDLLGQPEDELLGVLGRGTPTVTVPVHRALVRVYVILNVD